MNQKDELLNDLRKELEDILLFWRLHTIDHEHGGFAGEVDAEGKIIAQADKGLVLNARILWAFSAAYNFFKDEQYLELAHRAFDYLVNHFWDNRYDGLFWAVNFKGEVINSRKQIYGQGFGIYAFSEYFKASGSRESFDLSVKLFDLIETHSFDPVNGGYLEALSREWGQMSDMRLSPRDANSPKSMNTHLHILEPYSNLFRVWPTNELRNKMKNLVRVFLDNILNQESWHLHLFFDMDWTVQSDIVSYGHDIEGAWLINEAAGLVRDDHLEKETRRKTLQMVNAVIKDGLAPDNSLYYEKDLNKGELHKDRHWWVQAEALVGFMDAFEHTGETVYYEMFRKVWNYIKNHVIDHEKGEWFGIINDNGQPDRNGLKAGFWKCPYHNTRALIESIQRLQHVAAESNEDS